MSQRNRQRGTVLLMVIGLLTVIAMLGSMLLLMARLDRQTAQALATVAPEDQVAQGILDRLRADRAADLYIDDSSKVLYGKLDPNLTIAERQMIDYPGEDPSYDRALACIEPALEPTGNTVAWRHISNWSGANGTLVNNIDPNDPNLVDTDGDGTPDARLFSTGIMDREGGSFYAAVRMIDASGLLNVNVAGTDADAGGHPREPNLAYGVMDPGYLGLEGVLPVTATAVVDARKPPPPPGNGPYDMGDMLALGWRGADPSATNGRLLAAVLPTGGTAEFLAATGSLTVISMGGTVSPLWTYWDGGAGSIKSNPNSLLDPNPDPSARAQGAYRAFQAMLKAHDPIADPSANAARAAQLTVNLIDYLDGGDPNDPNDPNNWPTRLDARTLDPNFPASVDPNFYGIERHPYVSKVFRKVTYVDPSAPLNETAAIELINPYAGTINLTNYSVAGTPLTGKYIDPSVSIYTGRFVIYSDPNVVDPNFDDPNTKIQIHTLSTKGVVAITWKHPTATPTWEVRIDQTLGVPCLEPNATDPNARWNAMFRDDDLSRGRYTLARYWEPNDPNNPNNQDPNFDFTDPNGPKMGLPNDPNLVGPFTGPRTPVYVRNERMICLGDMMRLFVVGPTESQSLSVALVTDPSVHQLDPSAPSVPLNAVPAVPLGCMVSEFFTLGPSASAMTNGMININTAPAGVLKCLPDFAAVGGPGQLSAAQRDALVDEIIAYRDKGQAGGAGGRDYTNRPIATNIPDLRNQPGFATASEVAIPLRVGMQALPLTINTYGPSPPDNYALNFGPPRSDDGIEMPGVLNDPVKRNVLYTWMSNQVTVRSNTFIVYIRVQRDSDPKSPHRRYVAVIDRSNCPAKPPAVLMFTELR